MGQAKLCHYGCGQLCRFGKDAAMDNRIQHLRKKRGLSQDDLAERMDCSQPQVQRLERGGRRLSLDWMRSVAKALDCYVADLLVNDDNPDRLDDDERELVESYRKARRKKPDATEIALDSALLMFRRLGNDEAA